MVPKIQMKYCLESPNEVLKAKMNSRELITSRYEQELVWEAILKEYKEMESNV